MSDDLALFDLPAPPSPPVTGRADRGRARYRYARSVTAEVTVQRIPVLLDPIDGMWPLLEAGAATVLEADIDVSAVSPARYQVRWTVTIQLRDVAAFRRIAADACPAEDAAARAEITESLAAAWQRAAPPFTQLHRIPGITWSPVEAVVAHVPTR